MKYNDEVIDFKRVFRFLKKIIYTHSNALVFEAPLEYKDVPNIAGLSVKIAQNHDLSYLIEERGTRFENYARNAFEHGDICFIAEVEGKAVACVWARHKDIHLDWVRYTIRLNEKTISEADAYTHPRYRGKGIYRLLLSALSEYVKNDPKIEKMVSPIGPDNTLSMKVHKKMGFNKIVMKIDYTQLFGIKKHRVEKHPRVIDWQKY